MSKHLGRWHTFYGSTAEAFDTILKTESRPMPKRPMSAEQYKAALADFKLSQPRAGWIFGGKSRTSGRLWPAEGASYAVALIISIMRKYDITPDEIEEIGAPFRRKKK